MYLNSILTEIFFETKKKLTANSFPAEVNLQSLLELKYSNKGILSTFLVIMRIRPPVPDMTNDLFS